LDAASSIWTLVLLLLLLLLTSASIKYFDYERAASRINGTECPTSN
jgi:hypothetical protein